MSNMVQYGIWPNCCNNCQFCLRLNRSVLTDDEIIQQIRDVQENINYVDWKDQFQDGISLLGGEIYYFTNPAIQDAYMELIDDIIDKILLVSPSPNVKYSTVTNGLYDPAFLFRVIDRIKERAGIQYVDVNFSYDLKYRFATEERRLLCLENINKFHDRYNYKVGVQMILTQYVIDMVNNGTFNINKFLEEEIPGNMLCFLYPHKIHTGIELPDFFFKRKDFINFLLRLRDENLTVFYSFIESTRNSGIYKWTGYNDKGGDLKQPPILTGDKEIINPNCGHSILYQCYSDCDKCMLCDINNMFD